jgi:CheY-like chemotaxis protein
MPNPLQFLLVDDVDDNRFLITKTLARKFPGARVEECVESEAALACAKRTGLTAAIVHRAGSEHLFDGRADA